MCHPSTLAQDFLSEVHQRSYGIRWQLRPPTAGRTQVNIMKTQKREHSRKPDELCAIIEACSPGPFLEICARGKRVDWDQWGHEVVDYAPAWPTYANHSQHWEKRRA
jgi:hypothetical protein